MAGPVSVALMVTSRDAGIRGAARELANNDVIASGGVFPAMAYVAAPAAKSATNIVAATAANAALPLVVAASPDKPRNLRVTFAASWDGGDVVVNGTDQFDQPVSETFPSGPGTVVVGVKVFKSVTSAAHTIVGATTNTASVGTGDKLGVKIALGTPTLEYVDGTSEAVTIDAANFAFTPTTVPNGTHNYTLLSAS